MIGRVHAYLPLPPDAYVVVVVIVLLSMIVLQLIELWNSRKSKGTPEAQPKAPTPWDPSPYLSPANVEPPPSCTWVVEFAAGALRGSFEAQELRTALDAVAEVLRNAVGHDLKHAELYVRLEDLSRRDEP